MTASDRVVLRFLAAPGDTTTTSGVVSAGRLLEWIDKAAYACAVGWSHGYTVTAYVGNVDFRSPVHPGELVEVRARIVQTGRTSMHVLVSVRSRDPGAIAFSGDAMHCLAVMVAVDEAGRPREVPPWTPAEVAERDLPALIADRVALRREIQAAVEIDARLIHTTSHSVHVSIEARSAPLDAPEALTRNARCIAVYVVPEDGSAAAMRQFEPGTDVDRELDAHAQALIALRARIPALPASLLEGRD